ncbi:lysylphosphatidylglycerol synthase transmembrane domain-containing protein [Candidatus Halobeggiatoa sp. HSG11]|nr:lysylphosphatidylglycerol synthase transmembrane domain-containing protein [Candidatus Halobeggiatoa sp. HSG11]
MNKKTLLIIFGTAISAILLVVVFSKLDWQAFFNAIKTINIAKVFLAGIVVMIVIALRSLRWNLVACMPVSEFKHFWQAANIGYLGNMVYPARAGEVLKIIAINHFSPLTLGRSVSSAVLDRILDMIVIGIFTMLVLWIHGNRIDPDVGKSIIVIFVLAIIGLAMLITFADYLYKKIAALSINGKLQKLQELILHGIEGVQTFRHTNNLITVLFITVVIFLLDYFWMWQVITAFGWDLSFEAGLTVGVFLLLSISIPSAPGYVGVYQIACVLALGLYNIDQSLAVAYSIVLQLISFTIMGVQGILVTIYCSFNLSKEHKLSAPET